ncbi:MAG: class I SAM-dependent methyltransferase [Chloroflexota bacterium]|nr:class I SAM-dependent methyltransferase [Chloroflexota bacterium]
MNESSIRKIIELNHQFYQNFAEHFSDTRQRLQPGVIKITNYLPGSLNALDLGCGNGALARGLLRAGFNGRYVGIDFSDELLFIADRSLEEFRIHNANLILNWVVADLSKPTWTLTIPDPPYEQVLAFAVLHHLPGEQLHLRVLQDVRKLMNQGGCFIHSNWQFLNSPRLRKRIQSWERIGLTADDVDPGDHLLDWRRGGYGLRYAHQFSEDELYSLAERSSFNVEDSFLSDGVNGRLGLYQIWRAI